jgi:MraZ protein
MGVTPVRFADASRSVELQPQKAVPMPMPPLAPMVPPPLPEKNPPVPQAPAPVPLAPPPPLPLEQKAPTAALLTASVPPASPAIVPVSLEEVRPLPGLQARTATAKVKLMPLTGTYVGALEERKVLGLPAQLRDQLVAEGGVLVSPGSDTCLWLTTPGHLERLVERLERSQAREADVRAFRRLYFAQAQKVTIGADGRLPIPDRLAQFAGLDRDVVLVGIDDHVEVWDAARWKRYTQEKSAAARAAAEAE